MRTVRIARIKGIDIVADPVVLFISGLLAVVMYLDLVISVGGRSGPAAVLGAAFGAMFVVSIIVHELSHSVVARSRHLQVRWIRLFVFGGYSVIESDGLEPQDELVIAVAGPVASALAALGFWLLATAGIDPMLDRMLRALAIINGAIAIFNLLPGFPLDGGRVVRALLWKRSGDRVTATQRASMWGRVLGLAVVLVGVLILVFFTDLVGALWAVLGWGLYRTARVAGKREQVLARMDGLVVGDVMRDLTEVVPGSMTVAGAIEQFQHGPRLRTMPVEVRGRVRGILGESEIEDLSAARRAAVRAASAMTTLGPKTVVERSMPLDVYLARHPDKRDRSVVADEGRVVGIVDGEELKHLLEAAGRPGVG